MEGKPVFFGPGFEGFIPSFGPGEFISESGHGSWTLSTEALTKPNLPNNITSFEGIIKLKIVANHDDMGFDRQKKEGENMCSFSIIPTGFRNENFFAHQ
jgi:hypothetical protein